MNCPLTAIVFAKKPVSSQVKTRLCGPGGFPPAAAAGLAAGMLRCTVDRLRERVDRVVLAVSPDGCGEELVAALGVGPVTVVDQGGGDLGLRMSRVWQRVEPIGAVALFGMDAPDIPDSMLDEIASTLSAADVAIGPTPDGGYWTIAANRLHPVLLEQIDWGSSGVYDQTLVRAASAGLVVRPLQLWSDVDRPEDVAALRERLATLKTAGNPDLPAPLRRLSHCLDRIWETWQANEIG